jgi:hypothetical protein
MALVRERTIPTNLPHLPAKLLSVQLGYLQVTVQERLRIGWPGPFVKVEGCCD